MLAEIVTMETDHLSMGMMIGMNCKGQVHHLRREPVNDDGRHLNVIAAKKALKKFQKDLDFYYTGPAI